ncbi:MAG: MFS transporter [Sulfolobales archaeon]|nr:MFS transporter [Sulfolobales archaeon]MCG2910384.1 MFS transporter [Sulfolobales archaeon]
MTEPKANYLGAYLSWVMDSYDLGAVVITSAVLGKLFIPTLGILGATLPIVFTVVSRPLGAFLFGYLADLKGRKIALLITVLGYSLSIGLTGLLPTYEEVGIAASVALVALRMIQGIFIGGDVSTSFVLAMESVRSRRGLLSGVMQGGTLVGFVLVDALFTYLAKTTNIVDTWRYVFFIGALPAALALLIRLRVTEPEVYLKEGRTAPVLSGLRPLWQTLLVMIGFWLMIYSGPQFMTVYLGTYLGLRPEVYGGLILAMNAIGILAMALSGFLSDYIGRKWMAIAGTVVSLMGAWLLYGSALEISISVPLFGFLVNLPSAVTPAYLSERFKTFSRATGVGFSYNGAFLVAGFSQVYISLLTNYLILPYSALTVFSMGALLAVIGLILGPETLRASELRV